MWLLRKILCHNRNSWRKNGWRSNLERDEDNTAVDDVTTSENVIIEDEVTEVPDELKVAEGNEISMTAEIIIYINSIVPELKELFK